MYDCVLTRACKSSKNLLLSPFIFVYKIWPVCPHVVIRVRTLRVVPGDHVQELRHKAAASPRSFSRAVGAVAQLYVALHSMPAHGGLRSERDRALSAQGRTPQDTARLVSY